LRSVNIADTLSFSDILTRTLELKPSDSLTFADSLNKNIRLQKFDVFDLIDSLNTFSTIKKHFTDIVTLNEVIELGKVWTVSVDELILLSEIVQKHYILSETDFLVLTEDFKKAKSSELVISEKLPLAETLSKDIRIKVCDTFELIDTLIREFELPLKDSISFAEIISNIFATTPLPHKAILLTKGHKAMLLTKKQKTLLTTKKGKTTLLSK